MDLYGLSIIVILFQELIYLMKQICSNPLIGVIWDLRFYNKNSSKGSKIDNRL